jgi:hypothetical protein
MRPADCKKHMCAMQIKIMCTCPATLHTSNTRSLLSAVWNENGLWRPHWRMTAPQTSCWHSLESTSVGHALMRYGMCVKLIALW